jgi:ubiquitin-conjugating enzyme E2 W
MNHSWSRDIRRAGRSTASRFGSVVSTAGLSCGPGDLQCARARRFLRMRQTSTSNNELRVARSICQVSANCSRDQDSISCSLMCRTNSATVRAVLLREEPHLPAGFMQTQSCLTCELDGTVDSWPPPPSPTTESALRCRGHTLIHSLRKNSLRLHISAPLRPRRKACWVSTYQIPPLAQHNSALTHSPREETTPTTQHGGHEQQAAAKRTLKGSSSTNHPPPNPNSLLTHSFPQLQGTLPPGITLVSAPDLREWTMDISILDNPIYPPTDIYRLRFTFSSSYPIEAPEVVFQQLSEPERKIPLHPHIYSNGIICLDLLDSQGWSPVHNVESICISIQSMLAGNTKAESEYISCIWGVVVAWVLMDCRTAWRCGVCAIESAAAAGYQLPLPR